MVAIEGPHINQRWVIPDLQLVVANRNNPPDLVAPSDVLLSQGGLQHGVGNGVEVVFVSGSDKDDVEGVPIPCEVRLHLSGGNVRPVMRVRGGVKNVVAAL